MLIFRDGSGTETPCFEMTPAYWDFYGSGRRGCYFPQGELCLFLEMAPELKICVLRWHQHLETFTGLGGEGVISHRERYAYF